MKFDTIESEDDINKIVDNITKGNSVVLPNDSDEVTEDGLKLYNSELYYKTTGSEVNCFECGQKLVSGCEFGLSEYAYCDNCDIKYKRDRDYIVQENIKYVDKFMVEKSVDRILDNTYECQECESTHKYTEPDGDWERYEPYIHSYEGISLNCPCGNTIHLGDKSEDNSYECSKCDRKHIINLER